ncbi:MAG: 4Fe-4S binding protein, partial [Bacteroidales bacterium]|nr:4Fe-4S binding protein [Bacteroidales bacterium]
MLYKSLRWGRIFVALVVLLLTFVLFIDLYDWFPAKTFDSVLFFQFVPSLLSFIQLFSFIAAGGFLIILLLTLFTGRLYCSVICPLGILQDIVNRIALWRSKKKRFFKYKKAQTTLRYIFLSIMVLAIIFSAGWIITWLDPYSIAGRFFTYILKPPVTFINNLTASGLTK